MNDIPLPLEPCDYADAKACPKPQRRLLRTLFKMARPTYRFARRLSMPPASDMPPPESAAQWGEHIILEDIVACLHRDGTTTTRRHQATQLYGDAALAAWDEVIRYHDSRTQSYRILAARLMTPDGRWHAARNKTYPVQAPGPAGNTYGRTNELRFAPLRPGAIVELEEVFDAYKVEDFGPTLYEQFYLHTAAPCKRRRFTVAVARPFSLHYRLHFGAAAPTEREVQGYRVLTWETLDAEGVEFDEWTPHYRDFVPWLDVCTANTWAPFARQFRRELEPTAAAGHNIAEVAQELGRDKTTPLEKAAAAFTYAARTVRYGRPPAEAGARNSRSAESMLQDLRGDCKDKSALLVRLLRSMGIEAQIAVVLTGDAGRTPFLPSARFNHAIVRVEQDGQTYWLDPAAGPFAFGDLPNMDLGIPALVLGKSAFAFEWIRPPQGQDNAEVRSCTGRLAADGSYEFSIETRLAAESGARLRMSLADRTRPHRLRVLQSWLGADYPGSAGSEFTHGSVDDLTKRFNYCCRARLDNVARRIKDLYLVRVPWSAPLQMSGPLAATERKQPLAVPQAYHVIDRHDIELPGGALLYAAPDPVARECEWGRYRLEIVSEGTRLICERELSLFGGHVPAERFAEYQAFWRQCSWADGAEIVLKSLLPDDVNVAQGARPAMRLDGDVAQCADLSSSIAPLNTLPPAL